MIRKVLWLLLLLGYGAMVWHGATGDTGPMGWLNALQQHGTGGYSRKLSFLVFCFGTIALSSPILLPLVLTAPAKAQREAVGAPEAKPSSGWKTAAVAWSVPGARRRLRAHGSLRCLRQGGRATQGRSDGPRNWVWIGGGFHSK